MFYTFDQNNSFGYFTEDAEVGIGRCVIIEATSKKEAVRKAKKIIYFDGVNKGIDCDCCGDRWYQSTYGTEFPECRGQIVSDHMSVDEFPYKPFGSNKNSHGYIHYLDGRIVPFGIARK